MVEAYRYVMQLRHRPAVLVLSRQPLPTLDRKKYAPASGVARGAYVLADAPGGKPEVILIATGSEVSLAAQAHEQLVAGGVRSRVVSMPSWDVFEREPQDYRDGVLPPAVTARVAIEQASTFGWERYVGAARPRDRHAHLRRVGAAEGAAAGVRVHGGERRVCGEGAAKGWTCVTAGLGLHAPSSLRCSSVCMSRRPSAIRYTYTRSPTTR